MNPEETILSDDPLEYFEPEMRVLTSRWGYFIGALYPYGCFERKSGYYATREEAQRELDDKPWLYKVDERLGCFRGEGSKDSY
ncbi:MAG: hypothetical protein PVJ08_07260 [Dehalococcoidia bacterium]|jgi:hypothetical protein